MRVLNKFHNQWSWAAIALITAGTLWSSTAEARRDRGLGTAIGIGSGLLLLNEAAKAMNQQKGGDAAGPRRSKGGGSKGEPSDGRSPQQAGQQAPNSSDLRNYVQAEAERQQIELANRMESDRNVDAAVNAFIVDLKKRHQQLLGGRANVGVASGLNINEVTAGQIRAAAEEAYKQAHLYDFERFAGEIWTRDRLMVFVLRNARRSIAPYFNGAGAKGPSMADLTDVLVRSARDVNSRALETAELIGVSHSFDRFIRTIYENSDRADESLWTTGADGRYERMMSGVIDRVPRQLFSSNDQLQSSDPLGLERQFQFRFRARRTLYDCLAANYPGLIAGQSAVPASLTQGGSTDQSTTVRGARIDSPTQGATMVTISNDVWKRAESHVANACREGVQTVAKMAAGGEMRPQPARFDNAPPAVRSDRDLVPLRLPGAQQ
jgi:hypothetical protein